MGKIIYTISIGEKRGGNRLFITQVPKVVLFVCLGNIFSEFVNFDCFIHQDECSHVSTTNFNLQKCLFCVSLLGFYINLMAIV